MTTPQDNKGDRSRDEVLAGEYVLGVLPPGERLKVEYRMRNDKSFARMVSRWQENLSQPDDDYERQISFADVMRVDDLADPGVDDRRHIFESGSALLNSARLWQGLTLLACAFALYFASQAAGYFTPQGNLPLAIHFKNSSRGQPGLTSVYNGETGMMRILSASSVDPASADGLLLWLAGEGASPQFVGTFPVEEGKSLLVPKALRSGMKPGLSMFLTKNESGDISPDKLQEQALASGILEEF